MPMKTTHVFLDTVVFIQSNFDYASPRFASLTELAEADRIQVFLTDLTLREVRANLCQAVAQALSQRIKPILRNSALPEVKQLFASLDEEEIKNELMGQLDAFLEEAKVTVLPVASISLGPVLDAYFRKVAPFGSGKNKAEFPDALALETLRAWCAENNEAMAIVSHDRAVKNACDTDPRLNHFEDLPKYLDAVASENARLSAFVRKMVMKVREKIFEGAVGSFPQLGAYLTEVDGDVEDIVLTAMDFDEIEIISLKHNSAFVELPAHLTFTANLSYEKPATGIWDSEDKRLYFADRAEETVERSADRNVSVEVVFHGFMAKSFRVETVWVNGPDLEIESNYDQD